MPSGVYIRKRKPRKPPWNKGLRHSYTFVRTKPTWNKGLTKETDERVAKQSRTMMGRPHPMRAYKHSEKQAEASRKNFSDYFTNHSVWNKGLTKETSPVIADYARKLSITNTGKKHLEDTKIKMRGKRGEYRETGIRKISQDNFWANISPELKSEFTRRSRLKTSKQKTNPEILMEELLNKYFPLEWKYVGNGSLIVDGMIPDFANINGRKQVIEVYGDYWHKNQDPNDRISKFARFGYDCLVIWEHELNHSTNEIIDKIKAIGGRYG